MLNRLRSRKAGIDSLLETAGATMGDLGANLAGIFDAEDAEGAEEEETFPFEEPLPPGGEEEIFNRGVTGEESEGDNLQETQKTAGEPPAHAPSRTHQDSALLAALNNIIAHNSKDNTKQEFDWQPSYGHDNRNTFKEEVLAYHPKVKVFGFVQKGSPFVQIVHSPGRYVDFSAPPAMRGKILAFMGDRTTYGQPHPFQLPDINAWGWADVTFVDDAVGMATFFDDAENKLKLWPAPGGLQLTEKLPRLIYLPSLVARFCVEEQRTYWEVHCQINKLIDEEAIDEDSGKFIKMWLRANAQGDVDDPKLHLALNPAINGARDFTKWCFDHLNTFLGAERIKDSTPQAPSPSAMDIATVLRDMSAHLQGLHRRGDAEAGEMAGNNAKESTNKPYSVYDTAALMGFCGVTDVRQLPVIWGLFKTSKEVEDHRLNIAKRMALWSKTHGIPIDHSVFFVKETIEDIIKLRSNPGGATASLKTAERGPSILACIPRVLGAIETIRIKEAAAEESKANRTMKEAEKLAASDSREPPHDLLTLKLLVATYLALLWTLYSESCDLYQKLFAIYEILDEPEVMAMKQAFSPALCKQITWAVYDDSRSFFATRMHPDDFKPSLDRNRRIKWPTSLLEDVMSDIRYQRPIHRSNFPIAWRDPVPAFSGFQQQPTFPSPFAAYGGTRYGGNAPAPRQQQAPSNQSPTDKLAHLHPKIKAALQEYHSKFLGRVMIYRVLEAAGIEMKDLPKINQLLDPATGQNNLCYSHLLGICPHGDNCLFKQKDGHLAVHEVTDDFAEAVLRKIQPGITWMLSNEQPMRREPAEVLSGRGGGRSSGAGGGRGGRGRGSLKRKTPSA
jgi:hypothetical protein